MILKNTKSPIHLREILIALAVGIAFMILGGIFDLDFTKGVYNIDNTSYFGIFFSGIGELPVCIGLTFSALLFFFGRVRKEKFSFKEFLCYFFAIAALGFSTYYIYDTFTDLAGFRNTEHLDTLIKILGIAFAITLNALLILIGYRFLKNYQNKDFMLRLAILLLLLSVGTMALGNAFKYLVSRPRPRYIFDVVYYATPEEGFRSFYEMQPFACLNKALTGGKSNNLKSFPSGHSMYAALGMFVFPSITLLFDKTKDNRKLQIGLFYGGLAWTIIVMISRVYAGAHFLSDVGMGLIVTLIIGTLANYLIFNPKADSNEQPKTE